MNLKKKYNEIKNKIKENPQIVSDCVLITTSVFSAAMAIYFGKEAISAKEELISVTKSQAEDEAFCRWVYAHARRDNRSPKMMTYDEENDILSIHDMPTNEE